MEALFVALRVLLSLAVVLGLLWWLQRRLSRGTKTPAQNPVSVVTRQTISPKASVVVVDVDGNRLVLGVTEHSVSVLHTGAAPLPAVVVEPSAALAPEALEEADTATSAAAFGESMDAALAGPAAIKPVPVAVASPALAAAVAAAPAPALAGSILSLSTWKQAAASLRRSA